MRRQFSRIVPSLLALPQRVAALLRANFRHCTCNWGAKWFKRSTNKARAWRMSQSCAAACTCSGVAASGKGITSCCKGFAPASMGGRVRSSTPARKRRSGSSTSVTGAPSKGSGAPWHHVMRCDWAWAWRARVSWSLRVIQLAFSCSAASTCASVTHWGARTTNPSALTEKPMVRRWPRLNSKATRQPPKWVARLARGWLNGGTPSSASTFRAICPAGSVGLNATLLIAACEDGTWPSG